MLVLAATCRTHRVCNPPSSSAVATYFPSGEIAAVRMLPEAVNWLTRIDRKALCVSSKGAFDLKNPRKPRTAPRIKTPKPTVTPRRVFKLHRECQAFCRFAGEIAKCRADMLSVA